MARIVQSSTISHRMFDAEGDVASANLRLWTYNGLDCCVTLGVANEILPLANSSAIEGYTYVRAMQGPALDMMTRGILVNPILRRQQIESLRAEEITLRVLLDKLTHAVWDRDLNPDSPKQMKLFFYDALGMKPHYALRKTPEGKVRVLSCDHKALEAMAKEIVTGPAIPPYTRGVKAVALARPFVTLVLAIRTVGKLLDVVRSGVSADGRLRCSYNVGGTKTMRWSSSKNAMDEGANLQNITEKMRRMCQADEGRKLGSPDLEQAESRVVAALTWAVTGDENYWKACESGDLHTIASTMSYPEHFTTGGSRLGYWDMSQGVFIGDLKACRAVADRPFYRHLSMRNVNKRFGHGSNFCGTPMGIALMVGVEVSVVSDFQRRYFAAFKAIRKWHEITIRTVQTTGALTNPFNWTRFFGGRVSDDATLREAIAHAPQSTIGMLLNVMLYAVWHYGLSHPEFRKQVQLLLQVHDSIVFQYPDNREIERATLDKIKELMTISIPIVRQYQPGEEGPPETRMLTIPLEFKTGWNWAPNDPDCEMFPDGNPDGLAKWRGADDRRRTTPAKPPITDWLG